MKKTYISPSVEVDQIKDETLLAGSDILTGKYSDQTILSRRRNGSWYDNEDEE